MKFALSLLVCLLLAASAGSQTLLYQWNLNNATGTGATLAAAPSAIDASMTGGVLTNLNGVAGLSVPAGSGVNGANNSADLGLINSTAYRSTAGAFGGGVGNLSAFNSFTVSLWFNLNATVTSFSSLNGGALVSRLLDITTTNTAAADGDELYFALNTGTNLQFGVNRANTGTTTSTNQFVAFGPLPTPATMTNVWIFVAASYTTNGGGTVNLYTGTANSNAVLVSTLTGVGTNVNGWSATTNFVFIGNRGDGTRSLPGTIDNVNFYSGTQTLAQIIAVQTNALIANSPTAGVPFVSPSNTIFLGSSVTITSAVTGLAPLFFQWRTDGGSGGALTNIPGAIYRTLTNTPPNTGAFQFQLIVTNTSGSATSAVAVVNVQSVPGTANVTVNVSSNLAVVSPMAYGIHTSVYDNQNGNAALPTQLIQSGVNTLRYPGGGYADIFHWSVTRSALGSANGYGYSPWQDGSYAYMGSQTDFGNFVKLLSNAQCQAVITINWGSGLKWSAGHTNLVAPSTNAEPPEAAAWVAYANANTNIFGTTNDITLGTDSQGNNWQTAGYWAMMRAASPLGTDDGYNFLRLGRKLPVGIKYWEIGNETFGTGYYSAGSDGYSVNYAVPYPNATYTRFGNTNLSPAAYGKGVKSFSRLMKQVDPTIKIGAVVTPPETWDIYGGRHWMEEVLAQCATNLDFVANHSYPYAGSFADGTALLAANPAYLVDMIKGSGTHTGLNAGLRDLINAYRTDGTNVEIFLTEFGYLGSLTNSLNGEPIYGPVNALLAADSYATWLELGVSNVDWLEMNKDTFLGDGNPLVRGAAYYAIQLTHAMAAPGDTLVAASDDVGTLLAHAAVQAAGRIGVMLLNENLTNSLTVNVTIPNVSLATNATMIQFGTNNFTSANPLTPGTAPTTNQFSFAGNSFSVTVPPYTMAVLTIATNAAPGKTPPVLAPIGNQTVNAGQTVAFTASATDTNLPPPTLTFTLLAGATNATLTFSNGAFSWRPMVTQANSSNNFSLKVSDNGTPALSATQSFYVIVNPLTPPQLTNVSVVNGKFSLQFSGQTGPDYEVQSSTNLTQWNAVLITNPPTLPFSWTDNSTTNIPTRFYRIVIGPPLP